MANTEDMKLKFTVIKNEEVLSLPKGELWMERLNNISDALDVHHYREEPKKYLVINTDEPYADEIIEILKRNGHWG